MPAVLGLGAMRAGAAATWLPVALGLAALYGPMFYDLSRTLWRYDDYAHGPLILGLIAWLAWRQRAALRAAPASDPAPRAGLGLLVAGLLLYVLGRSQDIALLELGSLAPVLAGLVLALRGAHAVRALWFPLLFIAFLLPLPGPLLDALSGPLKQSVSAIAEELLYAAGYPTARTGVLLAIGPYQLLVADACAGLNSMFSLLAVGVLYLHLARRPGRLHNTLVVLSLLPIAYLANIVRVVVLVLVTYHFGDAAGQGFVHGFSGALLFATALLLILLLDAALVRALRRRAA